MHFQIICRHLVLALIACCTSRITFSQLIFKDGGAEKLLNEKIRTVFVKKGETARLKWVFQTNKNVVFHGIVWTIFDHLHQNYSKLLWMDRSEKLFRYLDTKDRIEYDVQLLAKKMKDRQVQLTIRIPNVQYVHQTTYICHVIRSNVRSSQIKLKIMEPPNNVKITSSNGNKTTVLENTQATFTCFVGKGTPDARVAWYKDNVALSEYRKNNVSFTKVFSKQDEGTYQCLVNNTLTTLTKSVHIYVTIQNSSEIATHVPDNPWNTYPGQPPVISTLAMQETTSSIRVKLVKRTATGNSGIKIKPLPVILITCSVAAVIFTIVAILFVRRRIRRAESKRNPRFLNSVGRNDAESELRMISHVNRRISADSGAEISWSNDNLESTRTGFSYQDSSDEYGQSDCPTTFTFGGILAKPVNFSRVPQHLDHPMGNTNRDFVLSSESEFEAHEIDRYLLQDLRPIGEGAFGIVAKAKLLKYRNSKEKQTVAVKMLKGFASPEDRQDLISELNIMRRVEPHNNVVRLIGCVTTSEPVYVIIEFVCHGDLLGFLRKSRGLVDKIYVVKENTPCSTLSADQLLRMARDVAMGMDHLSRYQVIHRDLAARNVLVGEHLQCKITDFGMARDVKSSNYYRKRSRGRIPLKWTAIEALVHEKYTIESDVWSFGVLLYEIVTIGGSPYPGLGARELLRKLKSGWRMAKPAHVDVTLYDIMKKCWSSNPDDRPTFSVLAKTFTNLKSCDSEYINVTDYDGSLYLNMEENSPTHSANDELSVQ